MEDIDDAIRKFLSENLTISVDYEEGGRAYYDGDHTLTVKLMLNGKVIDSDETSIPNRQRESMY